MLPDLRKFQQYNLSTALVSCCWSQNVSDMTSVHDEADLRLRVSVIDQLQRQRLICILGE